MTSNINGIDVSDYFIDVVDEGGGTIDYKILPNTERLLVEKIFEQNQQLVRLQKENEELKNKIESYICNANCYKYKEANKYKQSLEEISSIAENLITETPEYHSCYYKDECGDNCTPKKQGKIEFCCYENADKILTIINEVLNDRD